MKRRNYIKQKVGEHAVLKTVIAGSTAILHKSSFRYGAVCLLVAGIVAFSLITGVSAYKNANNAAINESLLAHINEMPMSAATTQKTVITIPTGVVKSNPFVPYRDTIKSKQAKVNDVPTFNLVAPPEEINENSDAARVMDTIVSGILYDKYSPSAILNIEGSDYLVKKGDVVNNYKVVDIAQDSVTVKLGTNTYKAGIGEILTEGNLNHNDVSNLNNKFGGERR